MNDGCGVFQPTGANRMPQAAAVEVCEFVRQSTDVVHPEAPATSPEKDVDDRWILAAAMHGKADVLVSGDRDLLEIVEPAIAIVSPRGFWELVR